MAKLWFSGAAYVPGAHQLKCRGQVEILQHSRVMVSECLTGRTCMQNDSIDLDPRAPCDKQVWDAQELVAGSASKKQDQLWSSPESPCRVLKCIRIHSKVAATMHDKS